MNTNEVAETDCRVLKPAIQPPLRRSQRALNKRLNFADATQADSKGQLRLPLRGLEESLRKGNSRVEAARRNGLWKEVDKLCGEIETISRVTVDRPVYIRVKFTRKQACEMPFRFIVRFKR
jgi:hypothetical protein